MRRDAVSDIGGFLREVRVQHLYRANAWVAHFAVVDLAYRALWHARALGNLAKIREFVCSELREHVGEKGEFCLHDLIIVPNMGTCKPHLGIT